MWMFWGFIDEIVRGSMLKVSSYELEVNSGVGGFRQHAGQPDFSMDSGASSLADFHPFGDRVEGWKLLNSADLLN